MSVPLERARAQLLVDRDRGGPRSVARRFLAVQAQAFAQARWALAARSASATRNEVDALFDDGALVRTWTMRGTLHVVPAEDARLMLGVSAEKQRHLAAPVMRRDGLDADVVSTAFRSLERALADRGSLERADAMDAMTNAGLNTAGGRGYHLIREAALAGIVVWGPVRHTQQALVAADDWLPSVPAISREEALASILVRYLQRRSPATLRDFAWWLGITLTEARRARSDAGTALVPSAAGGEFLEAAQPGTGTNVRSSPAASQAVALLPAYDEYLLGYRDRRPVLEERSLERVLSGTNGVFQPVIVLGGEVVGTWRAETPAEGVRIALSPFRPLPPGVAQAVRREARRYAAYLGTPLLGVV